MTRPFGSNRCTNLVVTLWRDDRGFVVSVELILIITILVIGLIAGLTALRDAIVSELTDVARSVQGMNQSFGINGVAGAAANTAGSGFIDATDSPASITGSDQCIVVFGTANEL
ncbi:MAG: hypothetical protein KDB00_18940 [Planctomycetales bacterium]|nr:hypothetical protein [Planctomycetales bacterium]